MARYIEEANLEEAAYKYADTEAAKLVDPREFNDYFLHHSFTGEEIRNAFVEGSNWQKERFEKNRLAHCDELTKEQAQIESDFVVNHLKKHNRTPTFIDAIEYGMRLQEKQMMSMAIDGRLCSTISGSEQNVVAPAGYGEYGKDGDKVKVILLRRTEL